MHTCELTRVRVAKLWRASADQYVTSWMNNSARTFTWCVWFESVWSLSTRNTNTQYFDVQFWLQSFWHFVLLLYSLSSIMRTDNGHDPDGECMTLQLINDAHLVPPLKNFVCFKIFLVCPVCIYAWSSVSDLPTRTSCNAFASFGDHARSLSHSTHLQKIEDGNHALWIKCSALERISPQTCVSYIFSLELIFEANHEREEWVVE